jgi:hypothetical protein
MKNCTLGFFSHLIESNHVKLHARLSHFNEINVKLRVDFGSISETVYIDLILNTIIER